MVGMENRCFHGFTQHTCKRGINYNKSEEKAKALSLELMKKYKVPVGAYKADVKNRNEVAEMVTKIKDELGTIVILVNNAGISTQKEF